MQLKLEIYKAAASKGNVSIKSVRSASHIPQGVKTSGMEETMVKWVAHFPF